MRFLPFLILALVATTAPTSMAAAPSHLHRMVTNGYATKKPTTEAPTYPPTEAPTTEAPTYPPTEAPTTEAPTYPPTEAPTTEAPTYPPTEAPTTEAPTYPPTDAPTTEAPTYPPTEAPTTSAPTVYYPPTDTPTELPTHPAPTQLTWCHHEFIVSYTEHYTVVESDLHDWMTAFLSFFGLDGTSTDYLTTSLIPDATNAPAVGNCTHPYLTTVDAYIRITLPSDIYPDFATRYDQYLVDHPWSMISSTTCGAIVELNNTCTNAPTTIVPTTIVPTTGPTVSTTTAPTSKVTSAPTTKTTTVPTNKVPTTKAPTGSAPTQNPTPTQKVNTTNAPTSAPTSSTITITTNVTQPDPNTRCIAGVCITVNGATSTHITIVPIIASIAAMIMAAF